jgi:prepilin-type N-terminal cleavage/methylation domain-containing protein/prepilin-type processing-associated H-X9-DG protein
LPIEELGNGSRVVAAIGCDGRHQGSAAMVVGHRKAVENRKAFTLVELLVVIGIIALLVGILLPALNRARDIANTIACASNLRTIGQGMAQYIADYRGVFPPSNYYNGTNANPFVLDLSSGTQLPLQPTNGYVHWSSFLFGRKDLSPTNAPFMSLEGWKVFQCPALVNGGIPPANTYAANLDPGQQVETPGVIDLQAPRLAYTVNEALCPRGIFVPEFSNRNNVRVYKFIQSSRVVHPADTILATELWGEVSVEAAAPLNQSSGAVWVSGSRRPVSGIANYGSSTASSLYVYPYSVNLGSDNSSEPWDTSNIAGNPADNLTPDPEATLNPQSPTPTSTLDWVGRNHAGPKKLGHIAFASTSGSWDLRKTNFLYVDGHVETKHITETIIPRNQWGDEFYTLEK